MYTFDCQMYVSSRQKLTISLPEENGPRKAISLNSIDYDQLVDPAFRRLLAAFESVPKPLPIVQV
jgi:hypothetical protein